MVGAARRSRGSHAYTSLAPTRAAPARLEPAMQTNAKPCKAVLGGHGVVARHC